MRRVTLGPLLLWLTYGCGAPAAEHEPPAEVAHAVAETELTTVTLTELAEQRLGIEVAAAERRSVGSSRTLGGEVIAPPGRETTIAAPVAGTVLPPSEGAIPRPGERARRGQTVLRLVALPTETDLVRIQQSVTETEARLENAQTRAARAEQLLADSAGTLAEVQDARADLAAAEADARAAGARYAVLTDPSAVDERGDLSALSITAPSGGLIERVLVSAGQVVSSGTPLFEVAATDPLWVRVPIYVGDAGAVDPRAPARIGPVGAPPGTATVEARRVSAPISANAAAASVDLYYTFANPANAFRPRQRVGVTLSLNGEAEDVVIPWSAVVQDIYGGTWVYESLGEQRYARRRVEVREVVADLAVIRRGLEAGTVVAVTGVAELFGTEFGAGGGH